MAFLQEDHNFGYSFDSFYKQEDNSKYWNYGVYEKVLYEKE